MRTLPPLAALLLTVAGCATPPAGHTESTAPPAAGPATAATPAPAPAPAERTRIQVPMQGGQIELLAPMPANMKPAWYGNGKPQNSRWSVPYGEPGSDDIDNASTEAYFRVECKEGCAPGEIAARQAAFLAEARVYSERPYIGTENDHVRGTLEVIAEETTAHGASLLAYRTAYPRDVGPWVIGDQFHVFCVAHRPGDAFFVVGFGRAPTAYEGLFLEPMLTMCRGMELVAD